MKKEFQQQTWDAALAAQWDRLLDLAIQEDLGSDGDCTTQAVVPQSARGNAIVRARKPGTIAGLPAAEAAARRLDSSLRWSTRLADGTAIAPGDAVAEIEGPAAALLAAERLLLNVLCRLSGVATLAARYVAEVAGTRAKIYDTRKTTPGWRLLEKYAVRCGGGWNHRAGLFEAILIKDNHLAIGRASGTPGHDYTPAEAVRRARAWSQAHRPVIIEVEVDTLTQLADVLPAGPDLVLLDNMDPAQLSEAVRVRDATAPAIELEASGGIDLKTVRAIAEAGVDRISVGALTHSASALDLGLDWVL